MLIFDDILKTSIIIWGHPWNNKWNLWLSDLLFYVKKKEKWANYTIFAIRSFFYDKKLSKWFLKNILVTLKKCANILIGDILLHIGLQSTYLNTMFVGSLFKSLIVSVFFITKIITPEIIADWWYFGSSFELFYFFVGAPQTGSNAERKIHI